MARQKKTLSIDEDLWRRVKSQCALLNTNVSTVVEDLMREWLAGIERKARKEGA
jgi:hypothetical protein